MNCANHPERTATAFCQNCGKPLCPECTRSLDGLILCEPCLLVRQAAPPAGPAAGWTPVPPVGAPGFRPVPGAAPGRFQPFDGSQASPVIAGLLGFIPGVGAMYNGQFVKALLHVVIFIVFIGASEHFPLIGLLIAAWVFYQVFDAAQTASARRDGRPLPDPFGILDMSQRLGSQSFQSGVSAAAPPPYYPGPPATPTSAGPVDPVAGYGSTAVPPASGAAAAPPAGANWQAAGHAQGYPREAQGGWAPIPPAAAQPFYPPVPTRRGEPIGAIVLIVVGLLFLLSTLGALDFDWITRGWPLLLLALGIWLLVRRVNTPPVPGFPVAPVQAPPPPPASSGIVRSPLSITPDPAAPASYPGSAEEDKQ